MSAPTLASLAAAYAVGDACHGSEGHHVSFDDLQQLQHHIFDNGFGFTALVELVGALIVRDDTCPLPEDEPAARWRVGVMAVMPARYTIATWWAPVRGRDVDQVLAFLTRCANAATARIAQTWYVPEQQKNASGRHRGGRPQAPA